MKTTRNIVFFFIMALVVVSCKKKKKALEGTYVGVEQYIHFDLFDDTLEVETYDESATLRLKDRKFFSVTKSKYPHSYSVSADELVDEGTTTLKQGIVPRKIYTVTVVGDSLYLRFEENNGLYGEYEHYLFAGKR